VLIAWILNIILIIYLFMLALRIVLGWFAPQALGKAWQVLKAATDPYLDIFSRIRFLRGSMFDFSPIAAILALLVVLNFLNQLINYGRIMLGVLLASIISAAWFGISFLLLFFLIVGVLRTIPFVFPSSAGSNLWRVVDTIIKPVVNWVMKVFRLGRRSGYTQHLFLTIGLLFAAWMFGAFLVVPRVVSLLQGLPI
jgi:YggT family protein